MPNPTASRGQLLNFAADVAWQFRAYDAYGQKESTDIRAIRKKCPEFTARQYIKCVYQRLGTITTLQID